MERYAFDPEKVDSLFAFRDFSQAEDLILEALYENPDDLQAITYAGILYTETGRFEEARKALEYVLARDPRNPDAWEAQGVIHFRRGQIYEAKNAFIAALKSFPRMASAFRNLGVLYRHVGDQKKSITCLQLARGYNPTDYLTLYALSFGLIEEQRNAEAREVLTLMMDQPLPPDILEYAQTQLAKLEESR
ncbi:tetratricopeptide repeat protein [Spirochaeta lutea]|uniref:Uncharacterized protein n=1 Tax=Spirochaeta lutea TaxID=1480694 RepID=A0A098QYA3_9SPIO|nr:tetratricopeptide repeat protein [Spirochaeta lutea]KGE72403.1 hypothetical protein DC28_06935 [Spirochaeta lutea]